MALPTGTTAPTGAVGPERNPSQNASTSMIALTVSNVEMTVPRSMRSPTFFSHVTSVPSVMVSESLGILITKGSAINAPNNFRTQINADYLLMMNADESQ